MKKYILLLMVGVFSIHIAFANVESKKWTPQPDVVITIKLNLHSKKLDCLTGFGFCKISINITFEDKSNPGRDVIGKTYINGQNQLVISLSETDLKNYENGFALKYINGKNSVYIDSDYELPYEVCNALKSTAPIVIKEGTYRISYDQGVYTLLIPQ